MYFVISYVSGMAFSRTENQMYTIAVKLMQKCLKNIFITCKLWLFPIKKSLDSIF